MVAEEPDRPAPSPLADAGGSGVVPEAVTDVEGHGFVRLRSRALYAQLVSGSSRCTELPSGGARTLGRGLQHPCWWRWSSDVARSGEVPFVGLALCNVLHSAHVKRASDLDGVGTAPIVRDSVWERLDVAERMTAGSSVRPLESSATTISPSRAKECRINWTSFLRLAGGPSAFCRTESSNPRDSRRRREGRVRPPFGRPRRWLQDPE